MTGDVRRASGFLAVGLLALVGPALADSQMPLPVTVAAVGPFLLVGVIALRIGSGRLFDLFARRGDHGEGRLYGLAGFSFAAAALALLAYQFDLPPMAFVAGVFVLTVGNLGQAVIHLWREDPFVATAGFAAGGTIGGVAGILVVAVLGATLPPIPLTVFLAASATVLGALLRSALLARDDPLVVLSTTLLLWFLLELSLEPASDRVAVGLAVTVFLGYLAYRLEMASVPGMLTGVLLALFAVVLGGYGWFVLLVTFFGLGGLASKYRYEEKLERGIAEANDGARGSGNVLANSAVALAAVVAFAASGRAGIEPAVFQFAFAGAVAAALADTFSSEFGGLFDNARLVTTLEPVAPGTDGGVTWQGGLAGIAGAGIIAGLGGVFFELSPAGILTVLVAGVLGMMVDSVLGASVEGVWLDNQGVNLFATLSAAVVAAAVVLGGLMG